jgi:hypothetical protein
MIVLNVLLLSAILVFQSQSVEKPRGVDVANSSLKIHVYKTGLFSAFGHNHEIEAPIQSGEVSESGKPSVTLRVDARKLKVLDPEDTKSRPQVQETMLGPQVLDSTRFPEIRFESSKIEPRGQNRWIVNGNLTLHGKSHPTTFDVVMAEKTYRGTATIKQTDFGMTPITVAGGSVKVKDEVKVEFSISLRAD